MGIKKTVTAGVIALGMTVAVAGSPASSSPDTNTASEQAVVKAERAAVSQQRAMSAAETAPETSVADGAKRKCVSNKKASRVHLFMSVKKVKKILGKPKKRSKSGGLWFHYWNGCTSTLDTELAVIFKKKGKKKNRDWRSYDVSTFWS